MLLFDMHGYSSVCVCVCVSWACLNGCGVVVVFAFFCCHVDVCVFYV